MLVRRRHIFANPGSGDDVDAVVAAVVADAVAGLVHFGTVAAALAVVRSKLLRTAGTDFGTDDDDDDDAGADKGGQPTGSGNCIGVGIVAVREGDEDLINVCVCNGASAGAWTDAVAASTKSNAAAKAASSSKSSNSKSAASERTGAVANAAIGVAVAVAVTVGCDRGGTDGDADADGASFGVAFAPPPDAVSRRRPCTLVGTGVGWHGFGSVWGCRRIGFGYFEHVSAGFLNASSSTHHPSLELSPSSVTIHQQYISSAAWTWTVMQLLQPASNAQQTACSTRDREVAGSSGRGRHQFPRGRLTIRARDCPIFLTIRARKEAPARVTHPLRPRPPLPPSLHSAAAAATAVVCVPRLPHATRPSPPTCDI
ncbi:hypothetical protein HDU84_009414 [Entophlyctis sp. JEL0112]|nr:hypothetical protein HDU84_009414 [Entophlyctis sp. JEL0112]